MRKPDNSSSMTFKVSATTAALMAVMIGGSIPANAIAEEYDTTLANETSIEAITDKVDETITAEEAEAQRAEAKETMEAAREKKDAELRKYHEAQMATDKANKEHKQAIMDVLETLNTEKVAAAKDAQIATKAVDDAQAELDVQAANLEAKAQERKDAEGALETAEKDLYKVQRHNNVNLLNEQALTIAESKLKAAQKDATLKIADHESAVAMHGKAEEKLAQAEAAKKSAIETFNAHKTTLEGKTAKFNEKNEILNNEKANVEDKGNKLEKAKVWKAKADKLKNPLLIADKTELLNNAQTVYDEAVKVLEAAQKEADEAQQQLNEAQRSYDEALSQKNAATEARREAKLEASQSGYQVKRTAKEIEKANQNILEKQERVSTVQDALNKLDAAEKTVTESKETLASKKANFEAAQQKVAEAQELLKKTTEIKELAVAHRETIQGLDYNGSDDLNEYIESINEKLAKVKETQKAQLKAEIAEAKAELSYKKAASEYKEAQRNFFAKADLATEIKNALDTPANLVDVDTTEGQNSDSPVETPTKIEGSNDTEKDSTNAPAETEEKKETEAVAPSNTEGSKKTLVAPANTDGSKNTVVAPAIDGDKKNEESNTTVAAANNKTVKSEDQATGKAATEEDSKESKATNKEAAESRKTAVKTALPTTADAGFFTAFMSSIMGLSALGSAKHKSTKND